MSQRVALIVAGCLLQAAGEGVYRHLFHVTVEVSPFSMASA